MTNLTSQNSYDQPSLTIGQIIAGPIIREATQKSVTFWMVLSADLPIQAEIKNAAGSLVYKKELTNREQQRVQVGLHAFVVLITLKPEEDLSLAERYHYQFYLTGKDGIKRSLNELLPDIVYPSQASPSFVIKREVSNLLHGSCRKPHHDSADGLVEIDSVIEQALENPELQPDMLIMSGDQVYNDDVAGPMLVAIHNTIEHLGLFHEDLPYDELPNSEQLLTHDKGFYQRDWLLPDDEAHETLISVFFKAKRKPIFTSVNANNHLVSLAEMIAMYCLVWSPQMWQIPQNHPDKLSDALVADEFKAKFAEERLVIKNFAEGLSKVQRALAHLPVYMIFDDHDVTDDWNLTRGWEEAVYNNPLAKRIIGNALIGYWLCQGWGNAPEKFETLAKTMQSHFTSTGLQRHDEVVDILLAWDEWHYNLNTSPKIVVLDTRTQRWRSESSLVKPSGLMDWEALCDLQQELINQPAVIMVSAAPVFGVKLIETVQRIFTFFGKALVVDAENWMAHKGTASVMLNIFRHYKTPPNFVILSGDVHYSFVYEISLKFRRNSPHITQITSSGIKNEFPEKLLLWFDRMNRILFGPRSPLNWFTQRRNMTIKHRRPQGYKLRTLYNGVGVGQLKVDSNCEHIEATLIRPNGGKVIFEKRK